MKSQTTWLAKLTGACALVALASPAFADKLIDNVNGITLDKSGKLVQFTGIVLTEDGKVKELLDAKDKRPKKDLTVRYNAGGKTMMPGFIDAHGHVLGLGFNQILLDLSDSTSLDDALARIRDYAARNPESPWIIGRGWNQEKWGLGRFPTAAELDRATGGRPAWLTRVDGHAGWANSSAMREAGVTAATKSPSGGRIEMSGSQPSGVFVDAAMPLIDNKVPKPLARDYDRAFAEAQLLLVKNGITTATDMGTTLTEWQALRRAGDNGRLKMRIISYAGDIDNMAIIGGPSRTPWLYDDRLRMVGVKLYLDGALGSRGAWLKQPYSDAPGNTGLPMLNYAQLRNKMVRASMDGFQVAIHAIGDRANDDVLEAVDSISGNFNGDRRWRIEHAQIVDPVDIQRFSKYGVIASMQPVHENSDWKMAEARLGPNRLAGAYAWKSIAATGSRVAFGSDFPVEHPNPLAGFAAAISREDAQGQPVGGWQPQEKVSREAAIDGFTRNAAFAGFAEDKIGILQPGMAADFVMLNVDPLTATPAAIRNGRVLETWVNGKPIYIADGGSNAPKAEPLPSR